MLQAGFCCYVLGGLRQLPIAQRAQQVASEDHALPATLRQPLFFEEIGALLLNSRWITPGSVDTTPYNHYSALRSYENLLGITRGGADGHGHLGFAAQEGLQPFGRDVFSLQPGRW